jgi:hypothetical protein
MWGEKHEQAIQRTCREHQQALHANRPHGEEKMKLTILQGDIFERLPQIPSDSIDLCISF